MDKLKFYLVNTGGYISVVDYATYEIIQLLNICNEEGTKEAKKFLTELSKLNNHSYIELLVNKVHLKHKEELKTLYKDRDKEKEDWIRGAWLKVTDNTLKDLGLDINYHYNKEFSEVLEEYKKIEEYNKSVSVNSFNSKRKKPLKSNKSNKPTKSIKPNTEANNEAKDTNTTDTTVKPKPIIKRITKHGDGKPKKPNNKKKRKLIK